MAVYKTDTGWRVEISFKDTSGKYRKKGKRGFKTKKEAEAWAAEYSVTNGKPTLKKGTLTLFSDYFDSTSNFALVLGLKKIVVRRGMLFENLLLMSTSKTQH